MNVKKVTIEFYAVDGSDNNIHNTVMHMFNSKNISFKLNDIKISIGDDFKCEYPCEEDRSYNQEFYKKLDAIKQTL